MSSPEVKVPALQVYVEAPAAVNVAVNPIHIVGELTVTTGSELTVTVETAVELHPLVVPVMV